MASEDTSTANTVTLRILSQLPEPDNVRRYDGLGPDMTVKDLKRNLSQELSSKPQPDHIRLIHAGHALPNDSATLQQILGQDAFRQRGTTTIHMIVRDAQGSQTPQLRAGGPMPTNVSLNGQPVPGAAPGQGVAVQPPVGAGLPPGPFMTFNNVPAPNMPAMMQNLQPFQVHGIMQQQFVPGQPMQMPFSNGFNPMAHFQPGVMPPVGANGAGQQPQAPAASTESQAPQPTHNTAPVPQLSAAAAHQLQQTRFRAMQQWHLQRQNQMWLQQNRLQNNNAQQDQPTQSQVNPGNEQSPTHVSGEGSQAATSQGTSQTGQQFNGEDAPSTAPATAQDPPNQQIHFQNMAQLPFATGFWPSNMMMPPMHMPPFGLPPTNTNFQTQPQSSSTRPDEVQPSPQSTVAYLLNSPTGPHAVVYSHDGVFSSQTSNRRNPPHPTTSSQQVGIRTSNSAAAAAASDQATQQQQAPDQQHDPAAPAPHEADIVALIGVIARHVWLLVRIFGLIWLLTRGASNRRTFLILLCTGIYLLAQAGVFGERPFERLRARFDRAARGGEQAQGQRDQDAGAQNVERGGEGAAVQRREDGSPRPRRPEAERGWLWERVGGWERAVTLFLASLYPGVGEQQVAARARIEREAREAEERRRQEEDARAQVPPAAEDTVARIEGQGEAASSGVDTQPGGEVRERRADAERA